MASSSSAVAPSRHPRPSLARTSPPNMFGRLPAELGIMVFQHLAVTCPVGAASLAEFLNLRLVCKLFDELIRSDKVAYSAVLAVNGALLRDGSGKPLVKLADISAGASSWWMALMDMRRLDRVWLDGAATTKPRAPTRSARKANPIPPPSAGYEVLVLDIGSAASSSANTKLSQYDSPCADVSFSPTTRECQGILGLLSHHVFARSTATNRIHSPHSIIVHLLNYPTLAQIASHALMHRGFGSPETNCDLPTSAIIPSSSTSESVSLRTNDVPWTVALGHVDRLACMYSLMCTDSRGFTIVHLRSYQVALDEDSQSSTSSTGTTVASICIPSHCFAISICIVPAATPTYLRLTYIHKSTRHVHMLALARATLALVSETTITHTKYFSHTSSPSTSPDLIAAGPMAGHMHICNVHTGALAHVLSMPAGMSAAGQKAHGATYRPLVAPLTGAGASAPAPARGQWMLEWTHGVRMRGDEAAASRVNKCHVHMMDAPGAGVAKYVVPPVQCSGVLGAHLYLVMSPNGDLGVVDLRAGCAAVGVWSVGAGFTRRVVASAEVGGEVRAGQVVVRRVAPERVGRIMRTVARKRDEAERRKRMGRGERAERRNRVREQMQFGELDADLGHRDVESDLDTEGVGQDEEENADDALWTDAGETVMLGERGDAVLAVRGSVVTILRRCVE